MVGEEIFIGTVFIAGIFSFFAPCFIPLLPVYISIFAGGTDSKKYIKKIGKLNINLIVLAKTMLFVGGISTSFIILGFGAGSLGTLINSKWFLNIAGLVVIILGIHQTGLIHLNFLDKDRRLIIKGKSSILGTFLLGFSFSFGWTPCVGPILAAVLGVSASGGQALYGVWLMFIYSLGLMLPFLILALFSDLLLRYIPMVNKHLGKIKVAGGIIIILMGVLLMNNSLNLITRIFE